MIIALTSFRLPQPISPDEARRIFLGSAPTYRDMPGLFSKHYVLSEDGQTAGGVYFWRSREDAEKAYSDTWRAFVRGKYGTDPVVTFFDNPVAVDNVAGEIRTNDQAA